MIGDLISLNQHLRQRQDFQVYLCFTQYISGVCELTSIKLIGVKGNLKSQTTTDLDILKIATTVWQQYC
jgi:hypothetical protein